MCRNCIYTLGEGWVGVDVWVVSAVFADWIICDVKKLLVEVGQITDAVFVMAALPYLSWRLLARGEGVSAFDELDRFGC